MKKARYWSELLYIARKQTLVLHHRQAFCLFPDEEDISLFIRLTTAGRNFITYQIQLIVESYYSHEMNLPKDIAAYLKKFADLLRKGENPRLFLVNNTVLSQAEAKKVLKVIKQLPEVPDTLSEKIRVVHAMTLRLLKLLDYSDEQAAIQLYRIAVSWMKLLESTKLQLFNVRKPLEYAGMHLKQHSRRVDRHTDRSIKWGREYDSYYRKYLSAGLCDQTARSKARKDFSEAHPAPVTDEELLCAYATPGISRQSLHKYHQTFLQFQAKNHKTNWSSA